MSTRIALEDLAVATLVVAGDGRVQAANPAAAALAGASVDDLVGTRLDELLVPVAGGGGSAAHEPDGRRRPAATPPARGSG